MKIFTKINEIRHFSRQTKISGNSVGFVPTMGALHQGHLSLIDASKVRDEVSVCSIFVNPTQFNNPEDLEKYPRNITADLEMLDAKNCDAVFIPSVEDIYENIPMLKFSFGYLEEIMEGKFRPGHFSGVGLIVSKLFNIVEPDRAYFGEKDLQQLTLIKIMTKELNFEVEIVPVRTEREASGLAMSSRNLLLSDVEKKQAANLYKILMQAKHKLLAGESIASVKSFVDDFFNYSNTVRLEYFEIVNTENLKNIGDIREAESVSLCIAGYLGKVRLIDNISLI
jgi:pantoate--beta-alanine ligase